jgi:RNA polymerase sigma-70 factor (ECF subfamily)
MTSDATWIEASVTRWERPLVAYVRRLLDNDDHARDVVQDTFLQLCRKPRAEIEHRLAEWLFAVARHAAIDRLRRQRRQQPTTEHLDERADHSPSEHLEVQESISGVLGALATLPRNQQHCIRLKFQQGLSYQQISTVTGLSVTNVGFIIHTGLKALRARLAPAMASTAAGDQP